MISGKNSDEGVENNSAMLADELMYDVMDEVSTTAIWLKLESRYMSKSLINILNLKQKLYGLKMVEGVDLAQHINTLNQVISHMLRIGKNSMMKIRRRCF